MDGLHRNGIPIESSGSAQPIHPTHCGWCLRTYPGRFTLGKCGLLFFLPDYHLCNVPWYETVLSLTFKLRRNRDQDGGLLCNWLDTPAVPVCTCCDSVSVTRWVKIPRLGEQAWNLEKVLNHKCKNLLQNSRPNYFKDVWEWYATRHMQGARVVRGGMAYWKRLQTLR